MKHLAYRVTLLTDTVVSQRSATAGDHQCLDYLPGAAFLGACAGRLYKELDSNAWLAFHSGQVRFHNALPLDDQGQPGFPMPFSFHKPKYPRAEAENTLINLARIGWNAQADGQPKQQRTGFLTETGHELKPQRAFRLKTAIDRDRGSRAADSQLFGYQFLSAGSQWYLQVDLDEEVTEEVEASLNRCLTQQQLRIGRSRSAEFGSIKVEAMPVSALRQAAPTNRLLVYCLSDLALREETTGMPCLRPTAELLGLPAATYNAQASFLRFRSYAPFNSHRGANDLERQVIVAGSVIAFDLEKPLSDSEMQACLQRLGSGVGDYRQDGLGQLWLNPPFLQGETFTLKKLEAENTKLQVDPAPEDQPLVAWLQSLEDEQALVLRARELARTWLQEFKSLNDGPTASQWRELSRRAETSDNFEELRKRLFGKEGLCSHGVSSRLWAQEHRFGQTFAEQIEEFIGLKSENQGAVRIDELCLGLAHLGRLAASKLRQEVNHEHA